MKADSASTTATKWSVVKNKIKRVLYYSVVLFGVIASIFIYWKYFYTYSTGYRTGLLQKFSHGDSQYMVDSVMYQELKYSYLT